MCLQPKVRPDTTAGTSEKILTGCGNLYVTINYDEEHKLCEVLTNIGRSINCVSAETAGRLISISLRAGVDPSEIIEQIKGIRCPNCLDKGLKILSCPDAIGRILEKAVKVSTKEV